MNWKEQLDEREMREIEFCRVYRARFGHGTDGHLLRILVAKMADLLDKAYWKETNLPTNMDQKRFEEAQMILVALMREGELSRKVYVGKVGKRAGISARKTGYILRNMLQVEIDEKDHIGYSVNWDNDLIETLKKAYGVE